MARIILPKHKTDFERPQMQDGQPEAISHPRGSTDPSVAIEVGPSTKATEILEKREDEERVSVAQRTEYKFWDAILGPLKAVVHNENEKSSKRSEEIIDPSTPFVADALANQRTRGSDAIEHPKLKRAEQEQAAAPPPPSSGSPSVPGIIINSGLEIADAVQGHGEPEPEPEHKYESLAEHWERKFWGLIFGESKAAEKNAKRGEEIVDPETPVVADALAKEDAIDSSATAPDSKLMIDSLNPSVADLSFDLPSMIESKTAGKPRANHHSQRECTHGGHNCVPRMRGHGGRPKKPKSQKDPEDKNDKTNQLDPRADVTSAMACLPSTVLCHFPSMQDSWICPKIKAREAEPAAAGSGSGGGAVVAPAIVVATGWTATSGSGGDSSFITIDENGMPSTEFVLVIAVAVAIFALCSMFGVAWCLKRRARRRAARREERGEVVEVEMQEMKGVEGERDERKS